MNSRNGHIAAIQIKLVNDIRKQRAIHERRREKIREKYPVDAYGIKGEMKIDEIDDIYIPYIKDMEWYSRALSDLVDMHEGEDNG